MGLNPGTERVCLCVWIVMIDEVRRVSERVWVIAADTNCIFAFPKGDEDTLSPPFTFDVGFVESSSVDIPNDLSISQRSLFLVYAFEY